MFLICIKCRKKKKRTRERTPVPAMPGKVRVETGGEAAVGAVAPGRNLLSS